MAIIVPPKVPPLRPPSPPGFFDPYAPGGGPPAPPMQPNKPTPKPTPPPTGPITPQPEPAPETGGPPPGRAGGLPPLPPEPKAPVVPTHTEPAPAQPKQTPPPTEPRTQRLPGQAPDVTGPTPGRAGGLIPPSMEPKAPADGDNEKRINLRSGGDAGSQASQAIKAIVISQSSQGINALVDMIVNASGCTYEEALAAIMHYTDSLTIGRDPFTGNALINRNPSVFDIIKNNLKGKAYNDVTKNVPIVVSRGEGANKTIFLMTDEQAKKASALTGRDRFEYLKDIGVYPSDYEWVIVGGNGGILTGEQIKLYETQIKNQQNFISDLKRNDPEGYKVYIRAGRGDRGMDAYLDYWEGNLKSKDPAGYQVYKDAGGGEPGAKAYNNYLFRENTLARGVQFIKDLGIKNAAVEAGNYSRWQFAMEKIAPYLKKENTTTTIKGKDITGASERATRERDITTIGPTRKGIDIVQYLKDKNDTKYLKDLGISDKEIQDARTYIIATTPHDQFIKEYYAERGWSTELPVGKTQKEWTEFEKHLQEADNVYYTARPEAKPSTILKEIVLGSIPVYGTVRYAVKASEGGITGSEAFWIGANAFADVVSLIPVVGQFSAAARGTFMAEKAGQFISTGVKLREIGKAAGSIAIAEVRAPFEILAHPIETIKSGLYSVETLVRGKKLPLSAIETKWNTMRIPISEVGDDPAIAMKLRDAVTDSLVRSKSAEAEIQGFKVELNPAAVNRLGQPTAITATPDIRPFLDGAIIGKGKPIEMANGTTVIMGEGRDLYLAPTFHSRFAESTSTGMIPKDPIPGGLLIRDENILKKLVSSKKTYGGTAEIETVLKAGENIDLGKPVQILTSRASYGKKFMLAVYGKPFTAAEIAQLKIMGGLDTLKQIFQTPVKVGKSGEALKGFNNLSTMAQKRKALIQQLATAKKAGNTAKATSAAEDLAKLDNEINSVYEGQMRTLSTRYHLPLRTVFVNGSIFDRYRQATGDKRGVITFKQPERQGVSLGQRQPVSVISPRSLTEIARRNIETPASRRTIEVPRRETGKLPDNRVPPEPPPGRVPPPVPPEPPPPEVPKPPLRHGGGRGTKTSWSPSDIRAAVAFQMGELNKGGKRTRVWDKEKQEYIVKIVGGENLPVIIARKPPYRDVDQQVFVGEIPPGMKILDKSSAYKSIQQLRGTQSPVEFTGKHGFSRFTVKNPSAIPGKAGAIAFGKPVVNPDGKSGKTVKTPIHANANRNKSGNLTASGFFLSTGAQEFKTTPAGSIIARPVRNLKRDIVPIPRQAATAEVIEVGKFNAGTLARIDKAPVRPLDFANAKNVPENLARKIQEYAKENKGVLYGSLNAYTKLDNAPPPHDIDLAFPARAKAQKGIMKLAAAAGYQAKPGFPHSVKIFNGGKWQEIVDVDSVSHHKSLLPKGISHQVLTRIDDIETETLGEQYLRQSYGAVSGTKKAPQRAEHVKQAAAEVKKMLQLAGAQTRGGKTHKTSFRTHESFRDTTKGIAKRLSGGDSGMRNVSKGKNGIFRTRVNGGTLISAMPIRGR